MLFGNGICGEGLTHQEKRQDFHGVPMMPHPFTPFEHPQRRAPRPPGVRSHDDLKSPSCGPECGQTFSFVLFSSS